MNNRGVREAISLGNGSVIAGELLVYGDGGQIRIGDDCFVGSQSRLWAGEEIRIGHRVLISHNTNIHDAIAHSLSAHERHEHFKQIFREKRPDLGSVPKMPIVIEDDVWIGFNVSIMRGVRIGRGAVIASGAIVTKDVAPFTIVAGPVATPIGHSFE